MIDDTPQHKNLLNREPSPAILQLTPLTKNDRQVSSIILVCSIYATLVVWLNLPQLVSSVYCGRKGVGSSISQSFFDTR